MSVILSIDRLFVRYNSIDVLSDISFKVGCGEYIGLAGPNGSGKTTLIKAILGLINPSSGNIYIYGTNPANFREWYKIGYLPQKLISFNPQFPATVKEIVGMGIISKKGFPKRINKGDNEAIYRALKLTGMSDLSNALFSELSGGQQQRVLISRALVNEPELLILDEPSTALDPETRENFYSLLHHLNLNMKTAIILVTHDIGIIGRYATKLLYLDKSIVFYGSFDDFCMSHDMTMYFGPFSQHLICHRHDPNS